jgi:hypothetical protein
MESGRLPMGSLQPLELVRRFQLIKTDSNNNLCLSCHAKNKTFANPAAIRSHTKHNYAPETTRTSRCSLCHRVKTASSAEAGDIHNHDFRIIRPRLSLEMFKKDPKNVAPNSCNGCHINGVKTKQGIRQVQKPTNLSPGCNLLGRARRALSLPFPDLRQPY